VSPWHQTMTLRIASKNVNDPRQCRDSPGRFDTFPGTMKFHICPLEWYSLSIFIFSKGFSNISVSPLSLKVILSIITSSTPLPLYLTNNFFSPLSYLSVISSLTLSPQLEMRNKERRIYMDLVGFNFYLPSMYSISFFNSSIC